MTSDYSNDSDTLTRLAIEEHAVKMRVLQLTEWKLYNDCLKNGYGLPPSYHNPFNTQTSSSNCERGYLHHLTSSSNADETNIDISHSFL